MRTQELVDKIKLYSEAYYTGDPLIDDSQFDELVEELKRLDPNNPILKMPGYGYEPKKVTYKHKIFMGSLDKIKDINKIEWDEFYITPKLDGLSCELVYENNNFKRAVTRGNGKEGVVVTKNIQHAIQKKINSDNVVIRGEVITTNDKVLDMDLENINLRNIASGLLMSQKVDMNLVQNKLLFVAFDLYINNKRINSIEERTKWFHDNNILCVPYVKIKKIDVSKEKLLEIKNNLKLLNNMELPLDGLVFENNSELIAYKFEDDKYETEIIDIEWNPSDYGAYIPTLILKEVIIDGCKISRCTGNNYKWLIDHKCGIGSKVEIIRSNMIIPKIVNVLTESNKLNHPTQCSACNTNLIIEDVHLICPNISSCPIGDYSIFKSIFNQFKVDGLGITIFRKIISILRDRCNNMNTSEKVEYFYNVLLFDNQFYETIKQNFGLKTFEKIDMMFDKIKHDDITYFQLFKCMNLEYISDKVIESFIDYYGEKLYDILEKKEYDKLKLAYKNKLVHKTLDNKYYQSVIDSIFQIFKNRLIFNDDEDKHNKIKIAITGKVYSAKTKKKFAEKYNVILLNDVTKETEYLICNESKNSNKEKKAKSLNIPIITEEKFLKIISEGESYANN